MQAHVPVEALRSALNKILTVVDRKSSRPILQYSLLEAKNGHLELSATDLEVSAKVSVTADVTQPGIFCVNSRNLFDILRELPDETVRLEVDQAGQSLKLDCGNIHYTLLIFKNDDFPQLVFKASGKEFELSAEDVMNIIAKTSHAISNDETRLYLNGIFLQEMDGKLRAVATDGHRLSLIESELTNENHETLINGVIIPKKGVFELKKMAESYPNKSIGISVDESFFHAHVSEEYYLSIRLIAREYPKYQAVIPSKTTYHLNVDKDLFYNAVKRIRIMSNEKSNGIRIKLTNNEMIITANNPSLGDAIEQVPISYEGKEMEIGFNAKYVLETLSTLDNGEVVLELNNELSPVIVKSLSLSSYLGIIMPLKL